MQRSSIVSRLRSLGLFIGAILFIVMVFRTGQTISHQLALKGRPNFLWLATGGSPSYGTLIASNDNATPLQPQSVSPATATATLPANVPDASNVAANQPVAMTPVAKNSAGDADTGPNKSNPVKALKQDTEALDDTAKGATANVRNGLLKQ